MFKDRDKAIVRFSGEKEALRAVSSLLVDREVDFVFHKDKGGYLRTIDMLERKAWIALHKELAEKHPALEIKLW
ncbi:hypothetical protein HGI30_11295 [Paenibacillus albicereus]|uniref:Uncharacterized protein n=1 Tax=Paenibacillus albicereus TaxID=2726185 RepID=A0A6H2GXD9_9BACL|nr:hypothetical protein [Paenibacillus albicereus]QJC52080.1 hypothetical protein HGI30_11295 [Paenibacillus albicereus]